MLLRICVEKSQAR